MEKERSRSRTMDDALRQSLRVDAAAARPPWWCPRDVTTMAPMSTLTKRKNAAPGLIQDDSGHPDKKYSTTAIDRSVSSSPLSFFALS
jgi:hypothetical protein